MTYRAHPRSPYEVACPKCGAPALAACHFPSGKPILPHHARLKRVTSRGQRPVLTDRPKLWAQMKNLAAQSCEGFAKASESD